MKKIIPAGKPSHELRFEPAPLGEHFDAEDHGSKWHLFCKKCDKGWALAKQIKGEEYHPGNLLHLLNHAHSHK